MSKKESLPNKDSKTLKKKDKNRQFDLHGYSLDEANKKIRDLIINAYENHYEINYCYR